MLRARKIKRHTLLEDKVCTKKVRITCGLKFSHLVEFIRQAILKNWHIIEHIPGCHNKPYIGMRKNRSLKNLLISSDVRDRNITASIAPLREHYRYGRCSTCTQAITGDSICVYGKNIKLRKLTTCASKFIVYLIKCPCPLYYVSSPRRALRTHVCLHHSHIKQGDLEAPLTTYFLSTRHNCTDFQFIALEYIKQQK